MDQEAIIAKKSEKRVTAPVRKCGDLAAAERTLIVRQAASPITVSGQPIDKVPDSG